MSKKKPPKQVRLTDAHHALLQRMASQLTADTGDYWSMTKVLARLLDAVEQYEASKLHRGRN